MGETTPRTRPPPAPPSALDLTLRALGARPPGVDELAAMRALTRGNAEASQQRLAMNYLLSELCGVGRVTFAGEKTHGAAFRSGAQGVGIAIAQIGDAVLLRFPRMEESVPE